MDYKLLFLSSLVFISAVGIFAILLGTIVHKDVRKQLWKGAYLYLTIAFVFGIIIPLMFL